MGSKRRKRALVAVVAALAAVATATNSQAQSPAPVQPSFPLPNGLGSAPLYQAPPLPSATPITANADVVEDVIARINDQVITRTEYQRAQQGLVQEAKQENLPPAEFEEKERDLLRDMIDQQLLLSKGKELGITGDAETMRELDEIRKRYNLPDMDALQKSAEQQGISFEDFKQNVRNQAITQQVVRDEVGRHINITPSEERSYYQAHQKDFEQPEQVHLSEILVPTPDNATDAQVTEAQAKAEALYTKLKGGAAFADLARTSSGGPTASAGGDLGDFKRGTLGTVLENATFPLPAGQFTQPIRTRQGFVILKVDSHQAAGTPPLQQVEPQVQEAIYMNALQPALRKYLTQAREDAYLELKPGFTDTGATRAESRMTFSTYAPPPVKKKVIKKEQAEQQRAARAEQQLADARAKLAAKKEARAAAHGGGHLETAATSGKPKKIRREKIRYGQAPRNALPAGSTQVAAAVPSLGAAPGDANKVLGEAPGAAMGSPTQSLTMISTGSGTESDEDPLAPKAGPERKSRFSSRQTQTNEKKAELKVASAEVKASKKPEAATPTELADEKVQSGPLGLADPNAKKKTRHKRVKGQAKQRLEGKPKPVQTQETIAPTVNPTLGTTAAGSAAPIAPSSNQTTLPPATPTPPSPAAAGEPIPSVTSASPNAPPTANQPQP
jgi:peptidyl-prolyl cis-trans isomerase SurA